jgi:DNA-binding CsgD family transcriptional regulator
VLRQLQRLAAMSPVMATSSAASAWWPLQGLRALHEGQAQAQPQPTCALTSVVSSLVRRFGTTCQLLFAHAITGVDDQQLSLEPLQWMTALSRIMDGAPWFPASATPEPGISARQAVILERYAMGCTGRDIAAELGITECTVEDRLHKVCALLSANSRAAAMAQASRCGWICLPASKDTRIGAACLQEKIAAHDS